MGSSHRCKKKFAQITQGARETVEVVPREVSKIASKEQRGSFAKRTQIARGSYKELGASQRHL